MIHTKLSNWICRCWKHIPMAKPETPLPLCTRRVILRSWPKCIYREEYKNPEYSTCLQQICNLKVSWSQTRNLYLTTLSKFIFHEFHWFLSKLVQTFTTENIVQQGNSPLNAQWSTLSWFESSSDVCASSCWKSCEQSSWTGCPYSWTLFKTIRKRIVLVRLTPAALTPILLTCIISAVLEALWFKAVPQKFCYVWERSLHWQHSLEEASLSFQAYNAGSPPGPCREQSSTITVKDMFSELEHLLRYLDYRFRHLDYK